MDNLDQSGKEEPRSNSTLAGVQPLPANKPVLTQQKSIPSAKTAVPAAPAEGHTLGEPAQAQPKNVQYQSTSEALPSNVNDKLAGDPGGPQDNDSQQPPLLERGASSDDDSAETALSVLKGEAVQQCAECGSSGSLYECTTCKQHLHADCMQRLVPAICPQCTKRRDSYEEDDTSSQPRLVQEEFSLGGPTSSRHDSSEETESNGNDSDYKELGIFEKEKKSKATRGRRIVKARKSAPAAASPAKTRAKATAQGKKG